MRDRWNIIKLFWNRCKIDVDSLMVIGDKRL